MSNLPIKFNMCSPILSSHLLQRPCCTVLSQYHNVTYFIMMYSTPLCKFEITISKCRVEDTSEIISTRRKHLQLINTVYYKRFSFFSSPVAATVDLILSWIGPKLFTSNSNGNVGPIRDIIKSTVAATGFEQVR